MISNWLSAALARHNIHYGWVMVGVTFFTALISAGTVGAPGVFIVPLQHEFGWSTAEISSALSIRFVLFGLMAPFAAALLSRYGLRNVALVCGAARARGRHFDRERRDRSIDLPAAGCNHHGSLRLAHRARADLRHAL